MMGYIRIEPSSMTPRNEDDERLLDVNICASTFECIYWRQRESERQTPANFVDLHLRRLTACHVYASYTRPRLPIPKRKVRLTPFPRPSKTTDLGRNRTCGHKLKVKRAIHWATGDGWGQFKKCLSHVTASAPRRSSAALLAVVLAAAAIDVK